VDVRDFADMGRARDAEFRNAGLDEIGSASWVPVWLDAEEMIRGSLWPAVQAVADALLTGTNIEASDGRFNDFMLESDVFLRCRLRLAGIFVTFRLETADCPDLRKQRG
jgi:hypothetical protein